MNNSDIEYRLRAIATKERAIAVFEEDGKERLGFASQEIVAMQQLREAFNGRTPWGVDLIALNDMDAALNVCQEYITYLYEAYSGHGFGEETDQEMIEAVRKHALENYGKDGWDIVVECYEDADIQRVIKDAEATCSIDAITAVYDLVKMIRDHEVEISSAFDC